MRLLTYAGLETGALQAQFDKFRAAIERDDLRSVDMKKLAHAPYYRAKLNDASRVLVRFVRYREEMVCLALEIIFQHTYEKSRFLRNARIDESKFEDASLQTATAEAAQVRYLHPGRSDFHLLEQPISFDAAQEAIYRLPAPLVLVGSAGSGKTALTLQKLRLAEGAVLYLTQSAWLARSARALYFAHGYENPAQEPAFLSYHEFLETIRIPSGREVDFASFATWFERHRQHYRFTDAHQCFEEFRGVIGSQPEGVLDLACYLDLGSRQSIFATDQRAAVHALFVKYRSWLAESGQFDINLVAHEWLALAQPSYDLVVIDEAQDLTNVQLALALRTLKQARQFLLCGDSNQIVHPNFFSWSAVKQLFWRDPALAERQHLSVLHVNYRNARAVTRVANDLLKIKHARFGSIDRESNYLVETATGNVGEVRLLADTDVIKRDLDARTRDSAQVAVLVLRDEDKPAARRFFRSPLVFSVHEAKGLEYPTAILWNFVSGERRAYAEVCAGVTDADLQVASLDYRRAKDRQDHSLEIYKFYVNALYVALTRAVERVILVESDVKHPLLGLLGLREAGAGIDLQLARSSREEWEREAHKLEQQGKREQALAIRQDILKTRPVPWTVWNTDTINDALRKALDPSQVSSKPRQLLLDFALWHGHDRHLVRLAKEVRWGDAVTLFDRARDGAFAHASRATRERQLAPYAKKNFKDVLAQCDQYGVDHRTVTDATPLMLAAKAGNVALLDALLERGADIDCRDLFGWTAASHACDRAAHDRDYAGSAFASIHERIAPASMDLEVDGRLVRLDTHQGEFLILNLMLNGLKQISSSAAPLSKPLHLRSGFCAEQLLSYVTHFPRAILREERRKRSYVNHVLARAEVNGSYQPARKLWIRARNGYYLPNPKLLLRVAVAGGDSVWRPIYAASGTDLIVQGTGYGMVGAFMREFARPAPMPVAAAQA